MWGPFLGAPNFRKPPFGVEGVGFGVLGLRCGLKGFRA